MDKLRVETPLGVLVAEPSDNPDYPGIYISIERKVGNGKEIQLHGVALVEAAIHPFAGFGANLHGVMWIKPSDDGCDPSVDEVIDLSGIDGRRSIWIDDKTSDSENPGYDVVVWDDESDERDEELSQHGFGVKALEDAEKYMRDITSGHPEYEWLVRARVKK